MTRMLAPIARRRAVALGALVALAIPACASPQKPSVQAGDVDASAVAEAPKAGPPMGYPWAGGAGSLPTASAKAPTVTR